MAEHDSADAEQTTGTTWVATPDVARLQKFASQLNEKGARALGDSLAAYAGRVESVHRGELPASAAQPPATLRPELVALALTSTRVVSWFEVLRNVLVFVPVLLTWLALHDAVDAYGTLSAEDRSRPFIALWQQGFNHQARTLADTAFNVVAILVVLVLITFGIGLARTRLNSQQARITFEFAAALADASAVFPVVEANTPNEQLAEFARAGQRLTTELHDLAESLRDSTRPLTETMLYAQRSITEVSGAMAKQSEQLGRVTDALDHIAKTNAALDSVGAAMVTAVAALDGIHNSIAPSTEQLVELVKEFGVLVREFGERAAYTARATENFEAVIASQSQQASSLEVATSSLNVIADRILAELARR